MATVPPDPPGQARNAAEGMKYFVGQFGFWNFGMKQCFCYVHVSLTVGKDHSHEHKKICKKVHMYTVSHLKIVLN